MSEENKSMSVSEMIRVTSENTHTFLMQVADHIDRLETTIAELDKRLAELESKDSEV